MNFDNPSGANNLRINTFFCFLWTFNKIEISDIMDLRHQSSAMRVIMLTEDTHPWSATKGGNIIQDTIPENQ